MSRLAKHIVAVVMAGLLTGGCAITPRQTAARCDFKFYQLAVETPSDTTIVSTGSSFGALVRDGLRGSPGDAVVSGGEQVPVEPSVLILSGGSLNGAFGAGFLDEWRANRKQRRLPAFKLVTGISTGAILATFAFVDDPARAVAGYSIVDEEDLLEPLVSVKGGEPTVPMGYIGVLRKGAIADLKPLRGRLRNFIDDGVLRRVAAESARGRTLVVGVVDVDTGRAVALNLSEMAQRYVRVGLDDSPGAKAQQSILHDCYVEAVMASSSAPMAALPVFIDNRMFVDGGVRFGMFADEVGNQFAPMVASGDAGGAVYLLINGDQELAAKCGKADPERHCRVGDPTGNTVGAHKKWSFTALAMRSEKILANQVYRFSADRVADKAKDAKMPFHQAQMDARAQFHPFTLEDERLGPKAEKLCTKWKEDDVAAKDPVQFFPRYMRCLIDYGRFVEREEKWHLK